MDNFNKYWYFQNLISSEDCDRIIKLGNSKKLETAVTYDNDEKCDDNRISQSELTKSQLKDKNIDIKNTYVRDSDVTWLDDDWLYELICPKVREANMKSGWKYDIDTFESIQFTKYNSPTGFYGWHLDSAGDWHAVNQRYIPGISPDVKTKNGKLPGKWTTDDNIIGKVRKLSITINLSDESDYEGGLLKFDYGQHSDTQFHTCNEIKPKGSMIVFPSYTYHCVTPVTKGTRYSLVMWCLGRPFK